MKPTDQRLLLVKFLFMRASDALRTGGVFDSGLAVSLLQDAVELGVAACGSLFNAKPKDKAGFAGIWEATDVALENSGKAPLHMKPQMESLNKSRINFKHFGQKPDQKDAETHRINCEQFLSWLVKEYFSEDFAGLSLVSFVEDSDEKALLARALEALQTQDIASAMSMCADTLKLLGKRRERLYPRGFLVEYPRIDSEVRRYVDSQIAHLRSQVWDLEGLAFAQVCGVSPADFLVVKAVVPKKIGDQCDYAGWPLGGITAHIATRCVETIAHYSIGLSDQLKAPQRILADSEWQW
jgi:hypothetical protein